MLQQEEHQYDEGLQALEQAEWVVTKLGGLNACDFQGNFDRITAKNAAGKKQVVVISVLRTKDFNTTTHVNKLLKVLKDKPEGYQGLAHTQLEEIADVLRGILAANVEPQFQGALMPILDRYVSNFARYIDSATDFTIVEQGTDFLMEKGSELNSLTGWGEDLVDELYKAYFVAKGRGAAELKIDRAKIYEDPDSIRDLYHSAVGDVMRTSDLIIAGGYEAVLGRTRSYSDPRAAQITEALAYHGANVVMAVEKEQAILTADPRIIPDAPMIKIMSSKFAAEVFGIFGAEAGALHHLVVPILNGSKAKIVVLNPERPQDGTTCIYKEAVMPPTTIVAKKTVPVIRVYGPMSNEKGIAQKVMAALSKHSLDQIYTAENEIRVTLSASGDIEKISFNDSDVGSGYSHTLDPRDVVICISTHDEIVRGASVLKDKGIKINASNYMAEVGNAPDVNVSSYVMSANYSTAAVHALHNTFVTTYAA